MNTRLTGMSAKPSSASRTSRARLKPTRSNRPMPSRRVSRHSSVRHPASINVPYTGSQGSASCHGVGDARRTKTAATMACAPTPNAARKQHQCRAAPFQRSRLPPSKQGLLGIRVHEWNSSFLGEESHLLASSVDDVSGVIWFGFLLQITLVKVGEADARAA